MQEPSKIVTNRHKTVENRQKPLATGGNRKNRCEGFDNFRRCTVCVGGGFNKDFFKQFELTSFFW